MASNAFVKQELKRRELLERKKREKPYMSNADPDSAVSIYNFLVRDVSGQPVPLERYKNQVCVFVNIAITNSFTLHNFIVLKKVCAQFGNQGVRILLFPCNQFDQPEASVRTQDYVKFVKEYGGLDAVELFGKIRVNCDRSSPVWQYMKKRVNIGEKRVIKNPYEKFVVDQYGEPVARLGPHAAHTELEEVLTHLCSRDI